MGLPWFRMYVDFLEDPKMISLAFEDQRHFVAICALKAKGTLDQNCTPEMLNRIVAQRIWVDFAIVGDVKKRLIDAGLIDEFWQPLAWDKRQSKSDSSTDRVRKYRQRKQEDSECNGDETLQKRSSNVIDKKRREEKREEKKRTPRDFAALVRNVVDEQLFLDFIEVRKRNRAANTERALTILTNKILEAHESGEDVPALVERAIECGWKTIYPKGEGKEKLSVGGVI